MLQRFPFGEPGGIRTHDLLIRSQTLYPAELRAHMFQGVPQNSFIIITKPGKKSNCFSNFFEFSFVGLQYILDKRKKDMRDRVS